MERARIVSIIVIALFVVNAFGMVETNAGDNEKVKSVAFHFSRPDVEKSGNYYDITIKGADSYLISAGKPVLPVRSTSFAFPFGTKIVDVKCKVIGVQTMGIDKKIEPAPQPAKLGGPAKNAVEDEKIYGSSEPYPGKWFDYRVGSGIENGEHVAFLSINAYPVRYVPAKGVIEYASDMEIKIEYNLPSKPLLTNNVYDLLIISPSAFSDALQPLVEHKSSYNISTILVTTDEVYGGSYFTPQGRDDAEKIKYFIKNAIEQWGVKYVMLVGDGDRVPYRRAYADDGEESSYLSDLYFADIYDSEGNFVSWDSNNNNKFGEHGAFGVDEVDLYPDVYLGRLAATSSGEVAVAVNKIISYENMKAYMESWFRNIILCGGDTFPGDDDNIDEGEYTNQQVAGVMRNFNPDEIWASNEKINSPANINYAFYQGAGFADLSGHGSPSSWVTHPHNKSSIWLPYGGFKISNVNSLSNKEKLPIVVLGACSNSKFSTDCIAWAFVAAQNGGAIATLGNTGLGWGYSGRFATQGLSGYVELQSFRSYAGGAETFGEMWSDALTNYVHRFGGSMDATDYKTVEEWEPLGDPSLQIATPSGENHPPDRPEKPVGTSSGKRRAEYSYTASTVDPDGDKIYYMFDWGDGTNTSWLGPYDSGEEVNVSHSWSKRGTYEVKVKAKDVNGAESAWSDPLEVTMPLPPLPLFKMLMEWIRDFLDTFAEGRIQSTYAMV